jgi:hypothetical protein
MHGNSQSTCMQQSIIPSQKRPGEKKKGENTKNTHTNTYTLGLGDLGRWTILCRRVQRI